VSANLKPGVGKFEALLDPAGLGGGTADCARKNLFELSHVRNLVVHRSSIVDARFKAACPWRKESVGDPLLPGSKDFKRYLFSSYWYLAELKRRRAEWRNGVVPEDSHQILAEIEKLLDSLAKGASPADTDARC
jgi:hypothetical protein